MSDYFKGTILASPTVNSSSGDTYGTHHSVLGIGGYMEVKTSVERDAIPVDSVFPTIYFDGISTGRRRLGMLVHVLEDDTIYHLHPKVGGNFISYSTWTGYTDTQKYLALSANTSWYSLITTGSGNTLTGEYISKGYTQTTHGFIKGDVIGYDGSDFVKVSSSSAFTVEPLGIVSVSDYNGTGGTNTNFTLTYSGYINTTDIVDYTGGTLTNGTIYYLATSGYTGKLTKFNPNTLVDVSKPMLVITSGNTGIVLQYRGLSKAEQGLTIGEFNTYTGNTELWLNKTVTGATNIGYFSGKTGTQTITILTSDSLYNGNYISLYNNYYRDDNGIIRLGTPTYNGDLRRGYISTFTPRKSWLYNTYTGSSNQVGWILVDGDISLNVGNFLTAGNTAANAGTPPFTETEWWYTGGTMSDGYYSNTALSLDVNGNLYTGETYNVGGPVYRDKRYSELRLRTIVSNSPSTLKVSYNDNFIYISGSSTGNTYSLTGITGVTNIGIGYGIYDSIVNNDIQLKSIIGSGSTTVSSTTGGTLIINTVVPTDTITGVTNLGSGEGIYNGISGNTLYLNSIIGSGDTTVNTSGNTIIINTNIPTDTITGATNLGTGATIYDSITDYNIGFNTIVGSGQTIVTNSASGNTIIIHTSIPTDTITGVTNSGSGEGVYKGISGNTLYLNSIIGSGDTNVSTSGDTIIIYSSGGTGTITATNGLTKVGNNVILGGTLTGNTSLTGNYTLSICGDAKLNTTCGYQISGTTMFRTAISTLSSIYIGQNAGSNGIGENNIGFGYETLYNNTTGYNNISFGCQVLYNNIDGYGNIGFGDESLYCNTSGYNNIAKGTTALHNNTTGYNNIAIGVETLYNNTIGCNNIAIGRHSLFCNTISSNNISLGYSAGYNNITGSSNVFIGVCAGYNETTSNKLYIANQTGSTLIYGDFSLNEVTLPSVKLCTTPSSGSTSDDYLVWDSSDKCVKTVKQGIHEIVSLSANTLLDATYANKIIEADGDITITFPNSMPNGMSLDIINISTGTTTLSASTTLVSRNGYVNLSNQWGGVSVYHRGSNIWWVGGDLSV